MAMAGGWEFVYDIVAGTPRRTWVTSDPLAWNSDGDIFSDEQEHLYGFLTRVSDLLNSETEKPHCRAPGPRYITAL